jgi:hypothetical protein
MRVPAPEGESGQVPRWLSEVILLGAILAIAGAIVQSLDGPFDLDWDDTNLAMSIARFDITQHQPHPPGYLGYVAILKLVHAVTGLGSTAVIRLVSRLFALLAILATWRAALRLWPAWRAGALWAAAFVGLHPILLYYGVDGQTHSAELCMAALLWWGLAAQRESPTRWGTVAVGLLLAAGGSLRPSFAVIAVGPVLWTYRRHGRHLAGIAGVAAAGTVAWFWPTVALTPGGLAAYRAASDGLMGNFFRMISPLSGEALPGFAGDNVKNALVWTGLAVFPAIVAIAARARSLGPLAREWTVQVAGWAVAPAAGFYALGFCAEAGYVAGLVPAGALAAAAALSPGRGRAGRIVAPVIGIVLLGIFLAAPDARGTFAMLPTANEIGAREARTAALYDRLLKDIPGEARVLVICASSPRAEKTPRCCRCLGGCGGTSSPCTPWSGPPPPVSRAWSASRANRPSSSGTVGSRTASIGSWWIPGPRIGCATSFAAWSAARSPPMPRRSPPGCAPRVSRTTA